MIRWSVLLLALAFVGNAAHAAEAEKAAPVTPISADKAAPAAKIVPPPPAPKLHVVKKGECPLVRDGNVWKGPDGQVVDEALANMGDCKHK